MPPSDPRPPGPPPAPAAAPARSAAQTLPPPAAGPAPSAHGAAGSAPLRWGAFLTLLALAVLFGANHVAARVAFNHGLDVATAVTVRAALTALVVALLVQAMRLPRTLTPRHRRVLPLISALLAVQSLCLYAAVARLPVALALLAFNTFPLWTALWAAVGWRRRPDPHLAWAIPVILLGLALALDVAGAASGLGARAQWGLIGPGVAFALAAAAVFGLALVITQFEAADLDGRVRTVLSMAGVAMLGAVAVATQGGFHWPQASAGWWGLFWLTVFYGTGFTVMFTLLPRLGVVGHSPILNTEPVAALLLSWWWLGQSMAGLQLLGALVVVATVMALGLQRLRAGRA